MSDHVPKNGNGKMVSAEEAEKTRLEVRQAAKDIEALTRQYGEESRTLDQVENSVALAICLVSVRQKILLLMPLLRALYNTQLGFKCDRPNKTDDRPYDDKTLCECACEALIRGVNLTGNMWNIIAGRCYITKEGFQYKLGRLPGLTGFRPAFGVPMLKPGGALVKCVATWTINGRPDKCETEFAVRLNTGMGEDGALGKAKRKLYAYVFDILTGFTLPDGDVDDSEALTQGSRTDHLASQLGIEQGKQETFTIDQQPEKEKVAVEEKPAEAKKETLQDAAAKFLEEKKAEADKATEEATGEAGPKILPHNPEWTTPEPGKDTLLRLLRQWEAIGKDPWPWLIERGISDHHMLATVKNKARTELCTELHGDLERAKNVTKTLAPNEPDGMEALRG